MGKKQGKEVGNRGQSGTEDENDNANIQRGKPIRKEEDSEEVWRGGGEVMMIPKGGRPSRDVSRGVIFFSRRA